VAAERVNEQEMIIVKMMMVLSEFQTRRDGGFCQIVRYTNDALVFDWLFMF